VINSGRHRQPDLQSVSAKQMSVQTVGGCGSQNPAHMSFAVLQVVPSVSVPVDEKHAATTGGGIGIPVTVGRRYSHDSPLAQSPAPLHTPWQMLAPSKAQSFAAQELLELQLLPS